MLQLKQLALKVVGEPAAIRIVQWICCLFFEFSRKKRSKPFRVHKMKKDWDSARDRLSLVDFVKSLPITPTPQGSQDDDLSSSDDSDPDVASDYSGTTSVHGNDSSNADDDDDHEEFKTGLSYHSDSSPNASRVTLIPKTGGSPPSVKLVSPRLQYASKAPQSLRQQSPKSRSRSGAGLRIPMIEDPKDTSKKISAPIILTVSAAREPPPLPPRKTPRSAARTKFTKFPDPLPPSAGGSNKPDSNSPKSSVKSPNNSAGVPSSSANCARTSNDSPCRFGVNV